MAEQIPIINKKKEDITLLVYKEVESIRKFLEIGNITLKREKETEKREEKKEVKEQEETTEKTEKKQSEFFQNLKETTGKIGDSASKAGFDMLLGPLQLITKPFEEFTGVNILDSIKGGLGGLFGKKDKKVTGKPSRKQILDLDPGAVYIADQLKGDKKKEKKGILGNLLGGLFGGGLGAIAGVVGGVLSIAAIAGSIVMFALDGIAGYFKAEEWGTSELSATIGGVLGGTGSGLEGAFQNMGKWAVAGAGVGFLTGGPIGALAGGLIGAAVGGILGFIGGENIAKTINAVEEWWQEELAMVDMTTEEKDVIYNKRRSWVFDNMIAPIGHFFGFIGTQIAGFFGMIGTNIWKTAVIIKKRVFKWVDKHIIKPITSFFKKISKEITKFTKDPIGYIGNLFNSLFESIGDFFSGIVTGISDFAQDPFSWVEKVWDDILVNVKGFFEGISKEVNKFAQDPIGYIGKMFDSIVEAIGGFFTGIGDFFSFLTEDFFTAISTFGTEEFDVKLGEFKEKKKKERKNQEMTKQEQEQDTEIQQMLIDQAKIEFLERDLSFASLKDIAVLNEILTVLTKTYEETGNIGTTVISNIEQPDPVSPSYLTKGRFVNQIPEH